MAEAAAPPVRFQMAGTRAALLDGPIEAIDRQICAIEDALEKVPEFAFDLSKTLVESVCKTILADLGQQVGQTLDLPKLVKETEKQLEILPRNHPASAKAKSSLTKIVNGLDTAIHGLCELRSDYGMSSHGRDAFGPRLGLRHATLAAQAADTIVAFLYRIHHDALVQAPGARVYYEDHADFNAAFDSDNEVIRLGELELLPSRVLYDADTEAYKAALNDFIVERNGDGDANDSGDAPDGAEETTP